MYEGARAYRLEWKKLWTWCDIQGRPGIRFLPWVASEWNRGVGGVCRTACFVIPGG